MRAIMQEPRKQQLTGIYRFRFKNKVYDAQVKNATAYFRFDVMARPANGEWELLETIPAMEMAINSPEWPKWREKIRTMVGKHFKQI